MRTVIIKNSHRIKVNESYEKEPLEMELAKIKARKEQIDIRMAAPEIYTDKKERVVAATNIRTQRMDIALEAMIRKENTIKAMKEKKLNVAPEGGSIEAQNKATGNTPTE